MRRYIFVISTIAAIGVLVVVAAVLPKVMYDDVRTSAPERDKQMLQNAITKPTVPHLVKRITVITSDGREPPSVSGRVEYRSFFGIRTGHANFYQNASELRFSAGRYALSLVLFVGAGVALVSLLVWQVYAMP